ncbi:MBL fold metallo-hydrolase [Nocardioides panacisoli]|uniref:MBL fold metallo-hydrolase n=1 Tax=Nocardioides panacisoli TaxID=627624 RepID=UPI001C63823F|nr:MBL fold metallo-hydrolase [Nocardioides panacisoli]QYJ03589.1 MBL fold metallo-hydrolase [Nocardioides panacisoli]
MTSSREDWTAPGCHPAAPGVHRIPLPMPQDGLRAINVYAVEGPAGLALIDAGWRVPGNLGVLERGLAALGARLRDIGEVYVTHVHRDHYTLAPELRRVVGSRVHLGAPERPGLELIAQRGDNQPAASFRELRRAGAGGLVEDIESMVSTEPWCAGDWEAPDHWLEPGPLTVAGRPMEAVAVPGHTKGHLVFHDIDAGHLFTGDHVLPRISPSIGFELGEWDLPLGRYLESLELILERPDAIMLPAHGASGGRVHDRVRELVEHHDVRLGATLAAVRAGAVTGRAVTARLKWTRRERDFETLDAFNQMIAVCETMAHLDLLVERGLVSSSPRDGVDRFDAG